MTELDYDKFLSEMYEFLNYIKGEWNSGTHSLQLPFDNLEGKQLQLEKFGVKEGYAHISIDF